ncbi:MAG: envelope stress response membrane protein PspC [Desulfobacterales bacterium]|jgi:phage shock protein C
MRKWDRIFDGGLYRSRNGAILGVCRGIADYFDFSLFWTRALAVIFLLVSGLWPAMALYFIAALLMKPEPVIPIHNEAEQEFYDSYTQSRHGAVHRLKRRYQKLERRIQRMEDMVTSREFDWENRLNS